MSLKLAVDRNSSTPVVDQIKERIRHSIKQRGLRSGERLPSVRGLASELGISYATVARAFRELQIEGILRGHQGKGIFVRDPSPRPTLLRIRWLDDMNESEVSRVSEEFRRAEPECELAKADEGADLVGLPLSLLPCSVAHLQDIEDLVLRIYGRSEDGRAAFDCLRLEGRIRMLPVKWRTEAIVVNREIFKREGIPIPEDGWNHADLIELAHRLTRPEKGLYGFCVNKDALPFVSTVWQNGGRVFDATGSHCLLAEPESVEVARLMLHLREFSPPKRPAATWGLRESLRAFCEGRVAMMYANSWAYVEARRRAGFEIGVLPLPEGRYKASYLAVVGFGVRHGVNLSGPVETFLEKAASMEKWPDRIGGHPPIPLHRDLEEDVDPEALKVYSDARSHGRTFLSDIEPKHRTELHLHMKKLIHSIIGQMLDDERSLERILCNLRDNINDTLKRSHL